MKVKNGSRKIALFIISLSLFSLPPIPSDRFVIFRRIRMVNSPFRLQLSQDVRAIIDGDFIPQILEQAKKRNWSDLRKIDALKEALVEEELPLLDELKDRLHQWRWEELNEQGKKERLYSFFEENKLDPIQQDLISWLLELVNPEMRADFTSWLRRQGGVNEGAVIKQILNMTKPSAEWRYKMSDYDRVAFYFYYLGYNGQSIPTWGRSLFELLQAKTEVFDYFSGGTESKNWDALSKKFKEKLVSSERGFDVTHPVITDLLKLHNFKQAEGEFDGWFRDYRSFVSTLLSNQHYQAIREFWEQFQEVKEAIGNLQDSNLRKKLNQKLEEVVKYKKPTDPWDPAKVGGLIGEVTSLHSKGKVSDNFKLLVDTLQTKYNQLSNIITGIESYFSLSGQEIINLTRAFWKDKGKSGQNVLNAKRMTVSSHIESIGGRHNLAGYEMLGLLLDREQELQLGEDQSFVDNIKRREEKIAEADEDEYKQAYENAKTNLQGYLRESNYGRIKELILEQDNTHLLSAQQNLELLMQFDAVNNNPQNSSQVQAVIDYLKLSEKEKERLRKEENISLEKLVDAISNKELRDTVKELISMGRFFIGFKDANIKTMTMRLLGVGLVKKMTPYDFRVAGGLKEEEVMWGYYDDRGNFVKGPFLRRIEKYLGGIDLIDGQRREDSAEAEKLARKAIEVLAAEIPKLNKDKKRPMDWEFNTRTIFAIEPPANFGMRQVIIASDEDYDINAALEEGRESLTRIVYNATTLFPDIPPVVVIGDKMFEQIVENKAPYEEKAKEGVRIKVQDLDQEKFEKLLPRNAVVVYLESDVQERDQKALSAALAAMKDLNISAEAFYIQVVKYDRANLFLPDYLNASLIGWLNAIVNREMGKQKKNITVKVGDTELVTIYSSRDFGKAAKGSEVAIEEVKLGNPGFPLVKSQSGYDQLMKKIDDITERIMELDGVSVLGGAQIAFRLDPDASFNLSDLYKLFGWDVILSGKVVIDPLSHIGQGVTLHNVDARGTWFVDNDFGERTYVSDAEILNSSLGKEVLTRKVNEDDKIAIKNSYIGDGVRIEGSYTIENAIILAQEDLAQAQKGYNPAEAFADELYNSYRGANPASKRNNIINEIKGKFNVGQLEELDDKQIEKLAAALATLLGNSEQNKDKAIGKRIAVADLMLKLRLDHKELYDKLMEKVWVISGFIFPKDIPAEEYYNALQATIDTRSTVEVIALLIETKGITNYEEKEFEELEEKASDLLKQLPQQAADEDKINQIVDLDHYFAGTVPHGSAKRLPLWYNYVDYVSYEIAQNELREIGIKKALERRGITSIEQQVEVRKKNPDLMREVEAEGEEYAKKNVDKFRQAVAWAMGFAYLSQGKDPLMPWTGKYLKEELGNTELIMIGRKIMRALLIGEFSLEPTGYDPHELTNTLADTVAMDEIEGSRDDFENAAMEVFDKKYNGKYGNPTREKDLARLLIRAREMIGSGIVDMNNADIQAGWRKGGVEFVKSKYAEARRTPFKLDMWDKFVEEVIDNPEMVTIAFIPDNHGEAVYDLKFIEELIAYRENYVGEGKTKVYFIPKARRGVSNDFSYPAAYELVTGETYGSEEPHYSAYREFFEKLGKFQKEGKFILVDEGPMIQGIVLSKITEPVFNALKEANIVILKGQANFEMSQGLDKVHYNLFIAKGYTNQVSTGFATGEKPYMFARIEPVIAPFGNYAPQGRKEEFVYGAFPNYLKRLYKRGILDPLALYLERERPFPDYGLPAVNFLVLREYIRAIYKHQEIPETGAMRSAGALSDIYKFLKEKFGSEGVRRLNDYIVQEARIIFDQVLFEKGLRPRNLYAIFYSQFFNQILEKQNWVNTLKNNTNISPENLMKLNFILYLTEKGGGVKIDDSLINAVINKIKEVNALLDKYGTLQDIVDDKGSVVQGLNNLGINISIP